MGTTLGKPLVKQWFTFVPREGKNVIALKLMRSRLHIKSKKRQLYLNQVHSMKRS